MRKIYTKIYTAFGQILIPGLPKNPNMGNGKVRTGSGSDRLTDAADRLFFTSVVKRTENKSRVYVYENEARQFSEAFEKHFKKNKKA